MSLLEEFNALKKKRMTKIYYTPFFPIKYTLSVNMIYSLMEQFWPIIKVKWIIFFQFFL